MKGIGSKMVQAIGYIDSGIGGLTVVKSALKQLPYESVIFLGDSARCPYGVRTPEEVREYTWEMVRFLLGKNVKMIVIACNTATAVALDEIRRSISIPIVGVIHPGSLAAIKETKTKKVAVLGTPVTIGSGVYEHTMREKNELIEVHNIACPEFVPLVESNQTKTLRAQEMVARTLEPLHQSGVDTVVLGCTHYPLLSEEIQQVVGEDVTLIDSGEETLTAVSTLLDYFGIAETKYTNVSPKRIYYTTGDEKQFYDIASTWLSDDLIHVEKVDLAPYRKTVTKEEPMEERTILVATRNKGKVKEFVSFFAPKGYTVKTLLDYPDISDVEETGTTFEENARLKAETIAQLLQTTVIADDSGLMVEALGGQPGVYSARFAGEHGNDAANNAKLLADLGSLQTNNRNAKFHCTLVVAHPHKESLVVHGEVHGVISEVPRGEGGFGYDPLFYVEELGKTFGEIDANVKNKLSHRANAIAQLMEKWDEWNQ